VAGDILRFAILGLGAGAVYGLTALGVVIVYRASGVVNFAAGATGMVGAFIFYEQRDAGADPLLAWVLALAFGAATGLVMQLGVMRTLRRAPALSRLIATLAVFTIFFTWADGRYGQAPRIVDKLLPVDAVEVLPGISVGADRLIVLGVAVALTVLLTLVYSRTRFGLATTAVAERPRAASARGISPNLIATVNWVLGSMLAVAGAILIVNIAGLSVAGLALLIIPALAAALMGGFRSLPLTLLGGLLIGVLESEVGWLQTYLSERAGHPVALQGWTSTVPFIVIILVLVIRGRSLPLRGEVAERAPEITSGRVPALALPLVVLVAGLVAFVASESLLQAITTSAAVGVVLASLVVVTGFAGQLSLAQFAFAGFGAWICAYLVATAEVGFELAALAGVAGAVPLGLLVGLPSLRARGVNLAVVTLGLALVVEAQIFQRASLTGGLGGLQIGAPSIFGIDLDPSTHPQRYALLAVGCLVAIALMVLNLRRSRAGRRLVAVRSNERAAASLGIGVFGAKLYAFGLSAGIAAVGGILLVFTQPTAVFVPAFSSVQSIFAVVYAVIGGIGFVLGAVLGGLLVPGGAGMDLLGGQIPALEDDSNVQLVLGLGLIVVLALWPNGLAFTGARRGRWLRRLRARRARPPEVDTLPRDAPRKPVRPATLELAGVGVSYGGVVALDDISLTVRPGEVVGLIGPNGAGKTTLIDAVTGFAQARGHIWLDGAPIERWSARLRAEAGLARSFQTLELFETMTLRENITTAAEPRDRLAYLSGLIRPGRSPLPPAAVAAVHELGLEDDLDRRPDQLSHGRRRLAAIARAIARRPSVLLLDEPAAGLDQAESEDLGRLVRRLADDWGMAVLLVEHDVSLVLSVCDQVVVLDHGEHLAVGPPDEIRQTPAVVAAYLGAPEGPATATDPLPAPGSTDGPSRALAARVDGDRIQPLLKAERLSAGYGDLTAVREIDLVVRPGEIVSLLGPNGAGKTTLLLTLAGELVPLEGSATVLGAPLPEPLHRAARRGLALVPEERNVVHGLSCGANLRLGRGEATEALELFPELRPLLGRRAGLLSGGEQQMLTLAQALAARPRLLLIDELSLGLAPLVVERLLAAVRAAADAGVGVLLVEQHATQALRFADRCVVLRNGRIELAGSAAELRGQLTDIERTYFSARQPIVTGSYDT
jgi:sulfate-transporting ATPase